MTVVAAAVEEDEEEDERRGRRATTKTAHRRRGITAEQLEQLKREALERFDRDPALFDKMRTAFEQGWLQVQGVREGAGKDFAAS